MGIRFLALVLAIGTAPVFAAKGGSDSADPQKVFLEKVNEYVKLRSSQRPKVPKMKDESSPERIAAHEHELAGLMMKARADAKQGDVFVPAVQPFFVQSLKQSFHGSNAKENVAAVKEGNPKYEGNAAAQTKIAVNAVYPTAAPVSTVPPSLLMKLPKLPEGLEYRFVGRSLILRDAEANLVVDYIPGVVPK